jgi:hypothetical protein
VAARSAANRCAFFPENALAAHDRRVVQPGNVGIGLDQAADDQALEHAPGGVEIDRQGSG